MLGAFPNDRQGKLHQTWRLNVPGPGPPHRFSKAVEGQGGDHPEVMGASGISGCELYNQEDNVWAEFWLVNKICYTVCGKIQPLNKMLTLLDVRHFLNFSKVCRRIIGMSRGSIFHAPKSSQTPYTAEIRKINNFTNEITNPLELRLDMVKWLGRESSD